MMFRSQAQPKPRVMARPINPPRRSGEPRRRDVALLGLVALVALAGLVAFTGMLAGGASPASAPPTSLVAVVPTATSQTGGSGGAGGSAIQTRRPRGSQKPEQTPTDEHTPPPSEASPTPATEPTPPDGASGAPTSPAGFDLAAQAIDIAFPLRPDTRYHYRDNFLDPREGPPDDYNHVRVSADGTTHRLHDGIDIYAAMGEPLVATFSGTVINPRTRWPPWEADRYGNTVAIVSDEPATDGYVSIYVHADRVWVQPGDHVTRGQVVGTLGRTGNAETQSVHSHLHFEIRAPFLLDWSTVGEDRVVDAFNPYPSLIAADPKRT
jgi:murein DD-endopeptidase MepM/ murein hydrolase activator NlpD